MVILLLFFNFVILLSLFSNETNVCPYSVTPFEIDGLNGKKRKKRHLHEKTMIPLKTSLSHFSLACTVPEREERIATHHVRVWGGY